MLFGAHPWSAPALHPSRGVGAVQTPDPDQPHLGPPMALELHLKLSLHLDLLLLSRTGGWDLPSPTYAPCIPPWAACWALVLSWGSPKVLDAAAAVDYMVWHYDEDFFSLACVAPSSSSVGSDCVVPPVSLPLFLGWGGEQDRAIGAGCVCLH